MSEHIATIHKETVTTSSNQSFYLVSVIWEYGELCDDTAYVDVTLARDDEQIYAHKVLDLVQHLSRRTQLKKINEEYSINPEEYRKL